MQPPQPTTGLELDLRTGLPDSLRVLLADYPRQGWASDPNYDGLITFWLDRHMMFRRLMEKLKEGAADCQNGALDPQKHAARLERFGSTFVGELHTHHNVEDMHYFPMLAQKDPRITAGFELLDKDHHAISDRLNQFVDRANAVLQPSDEATESLAKYAEDLHGLEKLLDRHLLDEEDLVVPVILKHGAGGLE